MPAPVPEIIRTAPALPVDFVLDPARNVLNSICFINKLDYISGLDPWLTQTAQAMGPDLRQTNLLVCEGLHYAIQPDRMWPSFPAYLDGLAAQDPLVLRDRILDEYAFIVRYFCQRQNKPVPEIPSHADLLADKTLYLDYLQNHFPVETINVEMESQAHDLLNDPSAMQDLIVSHLHLMWDNYFSAEWHRVEPMLRESIAAFQQVDFSGKDKAEILRFVAGNAIDEKWNQMFLEAERIIFVPSAHMGPYIGRFHSPEGFLGVFFGARLPEGTQSHSAALTRSELLVRLSALNDDSRLRILKLISEQGEMCAPDIISQLDLSQSAASRHLRQLTATGYLDERRKEGAKCYTLNPTRVGETCNALERFLGL